MRRARVLLPAVSVAALALTLTLTLAAGMVGAVACGPAGSPRAQAVAIAVSPSPDGGGGANLPVGDEGDAATRVEGIAALAPEALVPPEPDAVDQATGSPWIREDGAVVARVVTDGATCNHAGSELEVLDVTTRKRTLERLVESCEEEAPLRKAYPARRGAALALLAGGRWIAFDERQHVRARLVDLTTRGPDFEVGFDSLSPPIPSTPTSAAARFAPTPRWSSHRAASGRDRVVVLRALVPGRTSPTLARQEIPAEWYSQPCGELAGLSVWMDRLHGVALLVAELDASSSRCVLVPPMTVTRLR